MEVAEAFGRAVKLRRIELGLNQEELADKASMGRSFLSGIETGKKKATIDSVWKLAEALRIKPSQLWTTAERLIGEDFKSVTKS